MFQSFRSPLCLTVVCWKCRACYTNFALNKIILILWLRIVINQWRWQTRMGWVIEIHKPHFVRIWISNNTNCEKISWKYKISCDITLCKVQKCWTCSIQPNLRLLIFFLMTFTTFSISHNCNSIKFISLWNGKKIYPFYNWTVSRPR